MGEQGSKVSDRSFAAKQAFRRSAFRAELTFEPCFPMKQMITSSKSKPESSILPRSPLHIKKT